MQRLVTIKKYFRAAGVMAFFAVLAIYLPNKTELENQFEIYFGIPVSHASVTHEFFNDASLGLQQLNGVKVINPDTGKYTYYFEYIANKQDTLRRVAELPFLKDNRPSSLACELMNSPTNPLDLSIVTEKERDAISSFWLARAEDFVFYECYKSPVKHTLLLSKTSDRILHKVEFI